MATEEKAREAAVATDGRPEKPKHVPAVKVLAHLAETMYDQAFEAKGRGEMVGWSSSNFPPEIAETFGLHVVYPESQAAAISAKGGSLPLIEHAEGEMGFSNDICAYARINLAYADLGKCPNGEREMPLPDFVLGATSICETMMPWYEDLAYYLDVPMLFFDIPYNDGFEPDEKRLKYQEAQYKYVVEQLEQITGIAWDEQRFSEVCDTSVAASKAWLEATSYVQYDPSPMNGFDMFNHMAVATTARPKKEAVEAFNYLIDECRTFVKIHKSTFKPEEKYRILYEGIAVWPYLRSTAGPLIMQGVNVTGCVYCPAFAGVYGGSDDVRGWMRACSDVPNCQNLERATEAREKLIKDGKCEGALIHINRSCKMWSGFMPEMGRRIQRDLNIPVVLFDGDQSDPRNFSEAQYQTRLQGLIEIMESNKREKLGVGSGVKDEKGE